MTLRADDVAVGVEQVDGDAGQGRIRGILQSPVVLTWTRPAMLAGGNSPKL